MVIKCLEQIRRKSLLLSSLNPIEVPYARLFFDVSEPRVPELVDKSEFSKEIEFR